MFKEVLNNTVEVKNNNYNKQNITIGKTLFWGTLFTSVFDSIFGTDISEIPSNLWGGYVMIKSELNEMNLNDDNEFLPKNINILQETSDLNVIDDIEKNIFIKGNIEISINVYESEENYFLKKPTKMKDEFYNKIQSFIHKTFEKENIYKCDVEIYYRNKYQYLEKRTYKITTYKFSKNKQNKTVTTYSNKMRVSYKIFYYKNKNNYISFYFDIYGKIKNKSFVINGEETRYIYYYDDGFVENIKCSTKKRKDNIRLDRGKVFLRACNGMQYYLLTPNKYHKDKGFIQIIKDKTQIEIIPILFNMGVTREVSFNLLKNGGEFTRFDTMNECVLNFKDATYKTKEKIEREEKLKRILEEKKEQKRKEEEFKNGYHTKILDIDFKNDNKKQFVNGHMVKEIYNSRFKIFIDNEYKYRTLKGELIHSLDLYLKKCYQNIGKDYKKNITNYNDDIYDDYDNDDYSTDDYICEAFGGDEESWEDYCEDIAERYDC